MAVNVLAPVVLSTVRGEVPASLPAVAGIHAADAPHLKFAPAGGFQAEVRRRVEDYFTRTGQRPRDCPGMYVKSAVILAWFALSYGLLVFAADAWWQVLPLGVSLALAMAAVGFSVQHDARHHGYSERAWVNKLMALSLDLVGGSSYVWGWKHNILHHTYVNITGHDNDIDLGPLGRLSPHQPHRWYHRFQHWYLWPLYALVSVKWQLVDDFKDVAVGRVGTYRMPRPRGRDLLTFILGKSLFVFLALGLPLLVYPWWTVLLGFAMVSGVTGIVLSIVFQLAHAVGEAEFPLPEDGEKRMARDWAVHQVESTVDFAPQSRLVTWFLGGLNYQIEHHLFPRICHLHYPELAPIVRATCADFGIRYAVHPTVASGIAAHYRWLREMGRAPEPARAGGLNALTIPEVLAVPESLAAPQALAAPEASLPT